jgi:hypothetical protein
MWEKNEIPNIGESFMGNFGRNSGSRDTIFDKTKKLHIIPFAPKEQSVHSSAQF